MKAVDSHRPSMKPLFDVVSVAVIEATTQFAPGEDNQIADNVDQKLCVVNIVVHAEAIEERCCMIGPAAAVVERSPTDKEHDINNLFHKSAECMFKKRDTQGWLASALDCIVTTRNL